MADVFINIHELPKAAAVTDQTMIPSEQQGYGRYVTAEQIKDYVLDGFEPGGEGGGEISAGVSSFNGRDGAVEPADHDYNAGQVDFEPGDTGLESENVQSAIAELAKKVKDAGTGSAGGEIITGVTDFNGRDGSVKPQDGDYSAEQVVFDPNDAGMEAQTVQGAIEELNRKIQSGGGSGSDLDLTNVVKTNGGAELILPESLGEGPFVIEVTEETGDGSGDSSDVDLSEYAKLENPTFTGNIVVGRYAAGYDSPEVSGQGSIIAGQGNEIVGSSIVNALCIGQDNTINSNGVALGSNCKANGAYVVATGYGTEATSNFSFASGYYTKAQYLEFVCGRLNVISTGSDFNNGNMFIVGNGSSNDARSNAFRVAKNGTAYSTGSVNSTGADYAEIYEWLDGNPFLEDRVGRFVCLDGEKIRYATPNDDVLDILGIVSGNPSIVGDSHDDQWRDMYLRDVFGRLIYEDVEVEDPTDPEKTVIDRRRKLNPEYDHTLKYIPQSQRPEKSAVGLLGKLVVIDDGTCEVNGWCKSGVDGIAVKSKTRTRFRVMSRIDDSHIRVNIMVQ